MTAPNATTVNELRPTGVCSSEAWRDDERAERCPLIPYSRSLLGGTRAKSAAIQVGQELQWRY